MSYTVIISNRLDSTPIVSVEIMSRIGNNPTPRWRTIASNLSISGSQTLTINSMNMPQFIGLRYYTPNAVEISSDRITMPFNNNMNINIVAYGNSNNNNYSFSTLTSTTTPIPQYIYEYKSITGQFTSISGQTIPNVFNNNSVLFITAYNPNGTRYNLTNGGGGGGGNNGNNCGETVVYTNRFVIDGGNNNSNNNGNNYWYWLGIIFIIFVMIIMLIGAIYFYLNYSKDIKKLHDHMNYNCRKCGLPPFNMNNTPSPNNSDWNNINPVNPQNTSFNMQQPISNYNFGDMVTSNDANIFNQQNFQPMDNNFPINDINQL